VEGNVANVGKAGIVNVSKVKRSQVKSQDETGEEEEEEETELSKLHSACFLNRATSYFMLREYAKCTSDCDQAIKISPKYKKAYIRKSASQVVLGHFKEAIFTMQQGVEKLPGDQEMIMELNKVMTLSDTYDAGVNMLMNEEWLKAKNLFADMLASKVISSSNAKILLGAAQAEIGIGMCDRAMKLTLQVCEKYMCVINIYIYIEQKSLSYIIVICWLLIHNIRYTNILKIKIIMGCSKKKKKKKKGDSK
jgi:tetratricopeptide (TPR) repeat protein